MSLKKIIKYSKNKFICKKYKKEYMHYHIGNSFFENHQFYNAIESYKKCLTAKPFYIVAYFKIAESYIKLENFSLAYKTLIDLSKFITLKSDKAKFYYFIGFIDIKNKNYSDAIACLHYGLLFEENQKISELLPYLYLICGVSRQKNRPKYFKILKNLKKRGILLL